MKRLVIIDGMSVFFRGYYAVGTLKTAAGIPTGGVYGFAAMALKVVQELRPDKVVVAWDKLGTSRQRRAAIYPEYKAGRPMMPEEFFVQVGYARRLVKALHWGLAECDGYEADDIIGTFARLVNENEEWEACIISSDLDMLQVLNAHTKLYRLKKGFTEIEEFSVKEVEEKYGIRKEQFLDLKALKGDASDNIPGVPRIGEKGAVKLLNKYGDLDGVYAHLDEIGGKAQEKLREGKESAYMSYKLAKIMTDAPVTIEEVPDLLMKREEIIPLLEELEFQSLIERFGLRKKEVKVNESIKTDDIIIEYDVKEVMHESEEVAEKILGGAKFWDLTQGRFLLTPDAKLAKNDNLFDLTPEAKREEYLRQQAEYEDLKKVKRILLQLDFPLIPVLYKMEKRGMKIDVQYFENLKKEYEELVEQALSEVHAAAGEVFNVNSPKQMSEVLFFHLGLPTKGVKFLKKSEAYSTNEKTLLKLVDKHPVVGKILRYREAQKLLSTYISPMTSLADGKGRIHTSFTQNVTATGRLSSVNPNLQNIPTRTEEGKKIRAGFVASEGKVLVSTDYAQFELRLAAALAGDQALIDDFNSGVDIHKKTAAEAFGVPFDAVTKQQRRAAKVINFGIIYGMSVRGLADAAGMSFGEAREFLKRYMELRKPIAEMMERFLTQAREEGYVETYYGRRRPTPDVKAANYLVRAAAERAAQNMPIQGTEADLMKKAMLAVDAALPKGAELVLQVHDSLIVECDEGMEEAVKRILAEKMSGVAPELPVKLDVEVTVGKNWGEL